MAVALERVKRQVSVKQYQLFDLNVLQQVAVLATAGALPVSIASV